MRELSSPTSCAPLALSAFTSKVIRDHGLLCCLLAPFNLHNVYLSLQSAVHRARYADAIQAYRGELTSALDRQLQKPPEKLTFSYAMAIVLGNKSSQARTRLKRTLGNGPYSAALYYEVGACSTAMPLNLRFVHLPHAALS